jgi:polyisoprenoid-binding protein YceI
MRPSILLAVALATLSAQDKKIDVERSTITIHVGKAGLLSALGHDHWINAPISSGSFNDSPDALRVEFRVETAKMKVKPDPKVDSKTEATIQKDMEEMTLEISKYPEITFQSTHVGKLGEGQWKVEGTLALHGVSKPVTVTVKRASDSYIGRVILKQTDFDIKPITVGGGSIKVKNEIEIEFQIFGQPA